MRKLTCLSCAVLLLMAMLLIPLSAGAATTATITVTATGSYVDISLTGGNWTMGVIAVNTSYYTNPLGATTSPSNPVVDGECQHTLSNDGSVSVDVTVQYGNMTGTGDPWNNSDDETNGSMIFGAPAQESGANWSAAVSANATAPFNTLISSLATSSTKKFVVGFLSPTAFTDSNEKSGTITLTASQS